jgi:coenzyme F420-dependent glucose-6-phosphate dehydrogenase
VRTRATQPPGCDAQAAATLAEMFPDRFWLAVRSGEALNESVTDGG